jgi:LEA14-like dessication related protein
MAVVALLALAACASLGYKFETPKLSIVGVELIKGDLAQQELRVHLHVVNPNARDLPISNITYEIEVAGDKFAHGESERDFVVPASGERDFDVMVNANAAATVLKIATGGLRGGKLDYRLFGKVTLSSGLLRSLPFEQKGVIPLR